MPLAKPGDDLVLADGTIISSDGRARKSSKPRLIPVPSNTQAQRMVTKANRRLADLPALPAQLNVVSVILTYSLWGLRDEEIAIATGLTVDQIHNIREHEAYSRMESDLVQSVIERDSDTVRDMLQRHATRAAERVIELSDSEDDAVALRASQDVLDRAGHRPADVVEHRHTMEGGLRIEYVKRDDTKSLPVIDINPVN